MFIYIFEDGALAYSKDYPDQADIDACADGILDIVRVVDGEATQMLEGDWHSIDPVDVGL